MRLPEKAGDINRMRERETVKSVRKYVRREWRKVNKSRRKIVPMEKKKE